MSEDFLAVPAGMAEFSAANRGRIYGHHHGRIGRLSGHAQRRGGCARADRRDSTWQRTGLLRQTIWRAHCLSAVYTPASAPPPMPPSRPSSPLTTADPGTDARNFAPRSGQSDRRASSAHARLRHSAGYCCSRAESARLLEFASQEILARLGLPQSPNAKPPEGEPKPEERPPEPAPQQGNPMDPMCADQSGHRRTRHLGSGPLPGRRSHSDAAGHLAGVPVHRWLAAASRSARWTTRGRATRAPPLRPRPPPRWPTEPRSARSPTSWAQVWRRRPPTSRRRGCG